MRRTHRATGRVLAVGAAAVAAVTLAGCGGGPASSATAPTGGSASGHTVVDTRPVGQLGPVLTTASGQTLYMFPPDAERHVTCLTTCAATWPPLTVASGQKPEAGAGVKQSLLGTDPDPAGGPAVVTYDGWPLYTYQDDLQAGEASGQGINLDGGYWYVMAPSGQPITVGGGS
jgi:predicted lipoprotein with Yx(FWY)xxD motif